jgi:hypothetical protein
MTVSVFLINIQAECPLCGITLRNMGDMTLLHQGVAGCKYEGMKFRVPIMELENIDPPQENR